MSTEVVLKYPTGTMGTASETNNQFFVQITFQYFKVTVLKFY